MNQEIIIQTLKEQYPRDLRKQVVKSLLSDEKEKVQNYNIINQIFSYVLKESNWSMPSNSKEWDSTPLDIMSAVFPKIETTKWHKEQHMMTQQGIDVIVGEDTKN